MVVRGPHWLKWLSNGTAEINVVIKVAGEMELSFEDCHEFDVETFRGVYGDISELEQGHEA